MNIFYALKSMLKSLISRFVKYVISLKSPKNRKIFYKRALAFLIVLVFSSFVGFQVSHVVQEANKRIFVNLKAQYFKSHNLDSALSNVKSKKGDNFGAKSKAKKTPLEHNDKSKDESKDSSNVQNQNANAIDFSNLWKISTGGQYPNLSGIDANHLQVNVDLKKQRVYIYANNNLVYTMIVSSGMNNSTPKGDFRIGRRGYHFYNRTEGMGGDYWVGFIGTTYLFHSVPTRANFGDYIVEEAQKLGAPASHGCVRLSVPDANWFYTNIPDGTAVHIE